MIAENLVAFRRDHNESTKNYEKARQCFIDSLTLKQLTSWQKLMRQADRHQNMVDYFDFDISKVTKDENKQNLFYAMAELYSDYKAHCRRSQFELIQGELA